MKKNKDKEKQHNKTEKENKKEGWGMLRDLTPPSRGSGRE